MKWVYPPKSKPQGWFEHAFVAEGDIDDIILDIEETLKLKCHSDWDYCVGRHKSPWIAYVKLWLKSEKDLMFCKLKY